jgi:hypothetical protein
MKSCRVRIIAVLKARGLVLEVLSDQYDLIQGSRISRNDSLNAPSLGHPEDVHGFRHVKRHYAMSHSMHLLLGGLRQRYGAGEQQDERKPSRRLGPVAPVLIHRIGPSHGLPQ